MNTNGISHIKEVPTNDIWIEYTCLQCGRVNYVNIGTHIMNPEDAYENCQWECESCHYIHSKESDLPERFKNWDEKYLDYDSSVCQNFWRAFFQLATANPEYYWKQCKTCGRVLPSTNFARHAKWSEIEKQQECKACKAAINSIGNPKRTREQHQEAASRRRIGDLMCSDPSHTPYSDIDDLFNRFGGKCFMTGKKLDKADTKSWHIDHILPASYFWPLTKENAALLSAGANENKKAKWPTEVYNNQQLLELARITGADINIISGPPRYNPDADPNYAVSRYLKVRDHSNLAKRVAELIEILTNSGLIHKLSDENKRLLGL